MSSNNPYAIHDDGLAAIHAPADARAVFLQKTYSLLLAAILVFAGTLWAAGNVEPVRNLAISIFQTNRWIPLVLFIGGSIAVHALAETKIGVVVFFAFAFLWGLISAPVVLYVAGMENGPTTITQAALITTFIFAGLTAYVFKSGKDFQFMGGFLFAGMIGLFGIAIAGMIFGFNVGIWYSYASAAIFAGYILYDTSNILQRYPTTAYVSAAMVLFVDVVIMFKNILMILMSSDE